MNEIEQGISQWNEMHGLGTLESLILPTEEYEAFGILLQQRYPHIQFTGEDIDGRIFIQTDPN